MASYYSYILSILFLLLITHWTNTSSLHSQNKFIDHQNSESIRSYLPLIKRLRRWSKTEDNDEVEIPLNETIPSDDVSTFNTLLNFETIESNSSIIENVDDLINSTIASHLNKTTTFEIYSNENITMKYPLLRQDLTELNPTIEHILLDNKTDTNNDSFSSTILNEFIYINSTNITEINQIVNHDRSESTTEQIDNLTTSPSSVPIILSQTTDQVESTTATIPLDYTNTTENNQTNNWDFAFNDSFMVTTNDEYIINSNISQKDAIIPNSEMYINDTEILLIETNETSILSSIPICDQSCQCLKECPYGFEILNDTCHCNPPCQNYQCFRNDTCTVTNEGQPLCQPKNGTEYDRPTRCYQPRDAGYHDINYRYHNRWYYNPDQDTCHLFVYRGLGGNGNNFPTLQECHLECITCAQLPDPGECLGHINIWYYDKKRNECRPFEYSGCKGNENKFFKKEQCIDTCIDRIFNLK